MIGFTRWLCRMQGHPPIQPVIPNHRPSVPCRCGRYATCCDPPSLPPSEPGEVIPYTTYREPLRKADR